VVTRTQARSAPNLSVSATKQKANKHDINPNGDDSVSIGVFADKMNMRIARHKQEKTKNTSWSVPKLWNGSTCVILGGGPSLRSVNLDLFKNFRVIAVNNAYGDPVLKEDGTADHYVPRDWVDICWFGDRRWYTWHKKALKSFRGMLCCCREDMHEKDGIYGVCRGKPSGIDQRPKFVSWNKSSGGSAINLAYHLGVSRIILLGFDMRRVDNRPNWHIDHPAQNKNPYPRFIKPFAHIARDADNASLEIMNATPGSALQHFPIMIPEEAIQYDKSHSSDCNY
jgi:hypothetical protein